MREKEGVSERKRERERERERERVREGVRERKKSEFVCIVVLVCLYAF